MTGTILTDAVQIQGTQNVIQLTVQGPAGQTQPLSLWQTSGLAPLLQITCDGRLQLGTNISGGPADALIQANYSPTGSQPTSVWHAPGTVTNPTVPVNWVFHELQLAGTGGTPSVQSALYTKLTNANSAMQAGADLRAATFLSTNQSGSAGAAIGKLTGLRAMASNNASATLGTAVAVEAALSNDTGGSIAQAVAFAVVPPVNNVGTIATLTGLQIPDLTFGTANNYAIQTGKGLVSLGDNVNIAGTATVSAFKMATGAALNRVLTSDASGNGTWQIPTGGSATLPTGVIQMYGGNSAPAGWFLCDGSAVSQSTYAELFTLLGFNFGCGTPTSVANYDSSNYDLDSRLSGPSGAGGTTTISASGSSCNIGNSGGTNYEDAQSFQVTAGLLSQLVVHLAASSGSPTGTITWRVCADNSGVPGAVLASGTFTPTASADNTIPVSNGPYLAASTTYWLWLRPTTTQTSGNAWNWQRSTTSTYASGSLSQSSNGGTSWTNYSTYDAQGSITTSAVTSYDKLAQSFQVTSGGACPKVSLYLAKVGSPAGTLTLRLETDNAGVPSGTLVDANATTTLAESSLGTSIALVDFSFPNAFTLSTGPTYWAVLSSDRASSNTNYVVWGVDGSSPTYTSGNWATHASSAWTADTAKDAIFTVFVTTTFSLPDLRSRVPVGAGQGSGLTNRVLAATGGEENHALTVAELAAHHHTPRRATATGGGTTPNISGDYYTTTPVNMLLDTTDTGSGTSHNNMQPFLALNFIIKT